MATSNQCAGVGMYERMGWFLLKTPPIRAVRYDDIYQMDKIKSLSFPIMFYRLYRGVAKYIVSGNTFSSFG